MAIIDIFSKRQRKLRGDVPDTYRYDDIPEELRVQIVHIMQDVLGNSYWDGVTAAYDFVVDTLCREYGVFRLSANYSEREDKMMDLINFFLQEKNTEKVIDVIELSFRAINRFTRNINYFKKNNPSGDAKRAIEELNRRFMEHGIGYCFIDGKIIRVDSEFVHSEVVLPALRILNRREYAGAQEEFLQAHEHYRAGRAKEALNECLKSLESVMKSICDKKRWSYDQKSASAKKLIKICFDNGIVPSFWETQFAALQNLLEHGVPPARNRLSGHGQGGTPQPVPDHIAGYVLHMTAAAIVFLAEAEASGAGA